MTQNVYEVRFGYTLTRADKKRQISRQGAYYVFADTAADAKKKVSRGTKIPTRFLVGSKVYSDGQPVNTNDSHLLALKQHRGVGGLVESEPVITEIWSWSKERGWHILSKKRGLSPVPR